MTKKNTRQAGWNPEDLPPATCQENAKIYNRLAESALTILNRNSDNPQGKEVAEKYLFLRQILRDFLGANDCHLANELPELVGNDYYSGLVRLKEFCEKVAQFYIGTIPAKIQNDKPTIEYKKHIKVLESSGTNKQLDNSTSKPSIVRTHSTTPSEQAISNTSDSRMVAISVETKQSRDKRKQREEWIADIPKDIFDWDKPFTPEQIKEIESNIGPLAKDLEELAEFIETADIFLKTENNSWYSGVVSDGGDGRGDYDVFGVHDYSEDALAWVYASVLSAKKLRSKLEKIMQAEEAKEFYRQLQAGLRLVVSEKGVYLDLPSVPIPPERHNSAGSILASKIRLQIKITRPTPEKGHTCTLREFMENKCDLPIGSDGNYFDSKKELLNNLHRKKEIKLPKLVNKWKPGKTKVYREKDLLANWYAYRIKIPTLPPLKNSTSHKSAK